MNEDLFRHIIYALGVRANRWSRATRVWYSMLHWMKRHGENPSLETINIMINSTVLDKYSLLERKMRTLKNLLSMLSNSEHAEEPSDHESFMTVMMYLLAKDIVDRSSASVLKLKSTNEGQQHKEAGEVAKVNKKTQTRLSDEIMSLLKILTPHTLYDVDKVKQKLSGRDRIVHQYTRILKSCVELYLHLKSSAYDVRNKEMRTEWKTQLRFYLEQLITSGATVRPHLLSEIIKSLPFNSLNAFASRNTCDKMLDLISVAMEVNLELDNAVLGTLNSMMIDHSDVRAFKMIEIFTNGDAENIDFSSIEPVKQVIDKYPKCQFLDTMPASVLLNMLNKFMQKYPGDWESYEQSATKLAQKMMPVDSPQAKLRNYSIILDMYAKLPPEAYAKQDIWARAQKLLDDLQSNNIKPNHMCSSSFLYIAGRSFNMNGDRVFEALNILLDRNTFIHMDIIVSLLDNLVNLIDARVFHVYNMLRGDSLMEFLEMDKDEKMEPIPAIERLVKSNVSSFMLHLNPRVYSVMIKACSKFTLARKAQKYVTLATEIFNEARKKNMVHETTISSMLEMLGMKAKYAMDNEEREDIKRYAMLLMQTMQEKHFLQKNVAHITALLNVLCKCNEFKLAMETFESLDEEMMSSSAFDIILGSLVDQKTSFHQIQEFYNKYERYSGEQAFVQLFKMIKSAEDENIFKWICDQVKKHMGSLVPSQELFAHIIKAKVALGESLSEVQSFADRHIAISLGHDVVSDDGVVDDDDDAVPNAPRLVLEKDLIVYTHLLKCCVTTKEYEAGLLLFDQGKNLPMSLKVDGKNSQYRWYLNLLHKHALHICTESRDLVNGRRIFEEIKERGMADFMAYFGFVDMLIKISENDVNSPNMMDELLENMEKARSLQTPMVRSKMKILDHLYQSYMTSSKGQANHDDESS